MDAKIYRFPGPLTSTKPVSCMPSLDNVECLPTDESLRAVSAALEAINRELDMAIAVGEDSLRRITRMKQRARDRITIVNRERVARHFSGQNNPA